jgi:hypothetical protein
MSTKNTINGQPLEFGNREQIAWIRNQERIQQDECEGIVVPIYQDVEEIITYEITVKFICSTCLENQYKYLTVDEDNDILGQKIKCKSCQQSYITTCRVYETAGIGCTCLSDTDKLN